MRCKVGLSKSDSAAESSTLYVCVGIVAPLTAPVVVCCLREHTKFYALRRRVRVQMRMLRAARTSGGMLPSCRVALKDQGIDIVLATDGANATSTPSRHSATWP